MKKNAPLLVTVVFAVGALVYWAFAAGKYTVQMGELTALLEQGETHIDLTKVTNFEWTKVDAFGPYTTTDHMEEVLGVSIRFSGGEVLESNFELVFADDKKRLTSVTLNRKYGDYSVEDNRYLMVEK